MKLQPLALLACPTMLALAGCHRVVATAQTKDPSERSNVALSIYKDFASVREGRAIHLASGHNVIGISQISKQLDQSSVIFDWPKDSSASVVASTYDLGVQEGGSLLKRYVGRNVDLVRYTQDGNESKRITAQLEVADPDRTVLYADGKYLINPIGRIEAPAEAGIVTIPQLSVQVQSPGETDSTLNVSYLTRGLSWSADYVATLPLNSKSMSLECWASVTNSTGVDYPNASLTFLSGSPNVAVEHRFQQAAGFATNNAPLGDALAEPDYSMIGRGRNSIQTGELYSYKVDEPATLSQDQMSRVKMLSSKEVSVSKDYSIRLSGNEFYYYEAGRPAPRQNAVLAINFKNAKASGLGMPLPGGTVRVFEPDASGARQYIGAASLSDTPKDTGANLALSQVFDVWAQSRMTSNKKAGKHLQERGYSVLLHNSKTEQVTVRVVQDQGDRWKVMSESVKSTKLSAGTAQWLVSIPAGGETTLKYVVQVGV